MTRGNRLVSAALGFAFLLSACSGGGGGGSTSNSLSSARQDLDMDPDGLTTVVQFATSPGLLTPGNFEADGGQLAVDVSVAGLDATVEWDERVTPSHRVRAVGVEAVAEDFVTVTTSDASAPVMAGLSGAMNPGLGGDVLSVQFSGPRVIEEQAEDPSSWALRVDGVELDLAGSVFDLDPGTQVLTAVLGPQGNIHAAFELSAQGLQSVADVSVSASFVAGAGSGDGDPPSLLSAVQNVDEDELGYTVDFTFDEAMDPVFAAQLANFDGGFPSLAASVEQPSDEVLRVTFSQPMVPGFAPVDVLAGVVDVHGNSVKNGGVTSVVKGTPVTNDWGSVELRTVENTGGDHLEVVFVQALDPSTADDAARWSLDVDGSPVDLAAQAFTYDHAAKMLRVELLDEFTSGVPFVFGPAAGNEPRDVDSDPFAVSDFSGTVSGDLVLPALQSVVQNRVVDPDGEQLDVEFSEEVDGTEAGNEANFAVTGGLSVLSATLQPNLRTVRLVLDGLAVPGDVTLDVSGVADLAGNSMAPAVAQAVTSTDEVAPQGGDPLVRAVEGPENDLVEVDFDDAMISAEVLDLGNWRVESPAGVTLEDSNATLVYNAAHNRATLTFDGGDNVNFQVLADFAIYLTGMRDIGGNVVDAEPLTGVVVAEARFPFITSVWAEDLALNKVHVRFSEPCQFLDDVFDPVINPGGKTVYRMFDGGDLEKGSVVSVASDADDMGAVVTFSVGAVVGTDKLSMRGVTDLVGNQMFPVSSHGIEAEDTVAPSLSGGASVALTVKGEDNDVVTVEFDRKISAWGAEDRANYTLDPGGSPLDLTTARFSFDGDSTVTVDLDGAGSEFLQNALAYTLDVNGLQSAQGVAMGASSPATVTPAGDAQAPDLPAGRARIDAADPTTSVLIEMDEACDPADSLSAASYDIGGLNPDAVQVLGPRTVRATWNGGVTAGQSVHVTVRDLAGNPGDVTRAIAAADAGGPVVTGVAGVIGPGLGGDSIEIDFDFPLDFASASDLAHYSVSQDGVEIDLLGTLVRYQSSDSIVSLKLPPGTELDAAFGINVLVSDVLGHGGVAMDPPASVNGPVSGDDTAPFLVGGFVNYREDDTGLVVDLLFSEDVTGSVVLDTFSYSSSSGQGVTAVDQIQDDMVRLTFDLQLLQGDMIEITGVEDFAGNAAGLLSVEPIL